MGPAAAGQLFINIRVNGAPSRKRIRFNHEIMTFRGDTDRDRVKYTLRSSRAARPSRFFRSRFGLICHAEIYVRFSRRRTTGWRNGERDRSASAARLRLPARWLAKYGHSRYLGPPTP